MIYYILIAILLIFALIAQIPLKKEHQSLFKFISIISIAFVGSFRYKVGYDWFSYENLYNGIYSFSDVIESREEKFFTLFLYLTKIISDNFSFFIFIFFITTFLIKLIVIRKFSSDLYVSLFIYITTVFLIYDLNGIRQGMAMSITFLSTIFIYKRNILIFLVLIFIATLFHTSAIVFLPFYWLSTIKIKNKKKLIISMLFLIFLSIPFKDFILSNPLFQYIFSIESLTHYSTYVDETSEIYKSIPILSIATFQRIIIWTFFIYNIDKIKCDEKLKIILLNAYTLSILLFVFFSFSADFSARLSYYYKIFEIIIIPIIVTSQKNRSNKILILIFFSILLFIGLSRLLSAENNGLIPYNIFPFLQ